MGYIIRELRVRKGMTQNDLADKAGITRTTLWRLESGKGKVAMTKTLEKIANVLEVDITELFSDPNA